MCRRIWMKDLKSKQLPRPVVIKLHFLKYVHLCRQKSAKLLLRFQRNFKNYLKMTDSSDQSTPLHAGEYKLPEDTDISLLKKGSVFWKVRSFNKWYRRKYTLDLNVENPRVIYEGSNKYPCFSDPDVHIDVKDVADVRKGWKTDTFNKLGTKVQKKTAKHPEKRPLVEEECCFSIIYGYPQKTLDLVAPSEELRDKWYQGLVQVVAQNKSMEYKYHYQTWLKKQFRKADKDDSNGLSYEECVKLLYQLNIDMDERHSRKLFLESNVNKNSRKGEQVLDVDEFLLFYSKLLYRPELEQLIRRFGVQNTELMGPQELNIFAKDEQKMQNISLKDCQAIINGYEAENINGKRGNSLSLGGFRLFLLSEQQNLFNVEHRSVYQDMTRPLNHYFIASSHNTYLVADQLIGESSVEGYIGALKMGCRCVELDVQDGIDGEPIIHHRYTATTKILLKDVLADAIKPYAFVSSEYPVILSFENHCSVEQQRIIAAHLRNILGDLLYTTLPNDATTLPSPESLKNKIIIKAKKLAEDDANDDSVNGVSDAETEEELDGDNLGKIKTLSIAKELSDLVISRSVKFHSFEHNSENGKFYDIVSLSEKSALRLITDEARSLVTHTNRQLVRTYPGGSRTDSSNYNPIPVWNVGCQIVALNYQTEDKPNLFNQAMFQPNGNCGYILKPQFMLEGNFDPNDPLDGQYKKTLIIRIISGQHIPKPGQRMESDGDVVDPYVVIKVRGHEDDKQKFITQTVKDNGFNPVWDEAFNIPIKLPDLAFLHFLVKDHSFSGKDEKLGQCVISFSSIQQGYRHVTLVDQRGIPISPATLFIHVVITDANCKH